MSYIAYSKDLLYPVIQSAVHSKRGRQHLNLHKDYSEQCQRLFNVIGDNSYIRPHRHLKNFKQEILVAVKGIFALFIFNDEGNISDVVPFGSEHYHSLLKHWCIGVEIYPTAWHTIVALKPESILFEVKEGPFIENTAKEYAPWAPDECSACCCDYLQNLRNQALALLKLEKSYE